MRIAYGVMGYGRGHAMRTAAVLPGLMREHQVRVFAGRDAYYALHRRFDCEGLPVIGYQYDERGILSAPLTIRRNAALTADLLTRGAQTREVWRRLDAYAPDLVISDSETWTHRYARARGIPRISFDHVGVMAFCHCEFDPGDWWRGARDALGYKAFMGAPDRVLVSSFFAAPPASPGVEVVGPILRDVVRAARPERKDYLLAYFTNGEHQYTPAVDAALRSCGEKLVVYGTSRRGADANLLFKPPAHDGFVHDLAACKGVLATAGHQLLSEALYLGKPVLALPEDTVEQRLNACALVNLGFGARSSLVKPNLIDIGGFLERLEHYAAACEAYRKNQGGDGRDEALVTLRRFIHELEPPDPSLLARTIGAY